MAGEWYYKVMGEEAGPMSPAELKDLAESGFLAPDVLVRKGADGDWIPAGQVRGLFGETFEAEAAAPSKPPPADARRKGKRPGDAGVPAAQAATRPSPAEPPLPSPQPADADWYCRVMGKEIGPLSRSALKELAASGFLAPNAPVRQGIDGPWVPASEVEGLREQRPAPRPQEERPRASAEPGPEGPTDNRSDSSEKAPPKAPSKPQATKAGWYCQVMGEETGPLSSAELKELATSGFLTPDLPVRKGVDGSWVPASRVKGLFPGTPQAPGRGSAGPPPASRQALKPSARSDARAPADRASAKPAPRRPGTAQIGWYYQAMGQDTGPLSSADLKELATSGLLTPDMPVRMGTESDWLPAIQVLGLFDEPSEAAPAQKARRPTRPAGAAGRPAAKSAPRPTPETVVTPAAKAPVKRPKKGAPKTPRRPSRKPAAQPAAPVAPLPAGASGLGDFLDEALAEPTPGGSKSADVYATLPATPATRPPVLSPTPDPAAFESRHRGYDPTGKKDSIFGNGSIAGGLGLMLLSALWFFGGLAVGYIFFYPPILFLLGLGVFFKGLYGAFSGGD